MQAAIQLGVIPVALIVALAVAGRRPALFFEAAGDLRPAWPALVWLLGLAWLALNVTVTPLNDDEVTFIALGWAALHGESHGHLPVRYLISLPFALLPLAPSTTVVVARLATAAIAIVAAWAVARIAARLAARPSESALAGGLALLWMVTDAELAFLRVEYFAVAFLVLGCWFLLRPLESARFDWRLAAGFFFLTLGATTSHRQALMVLAGAAAAWCLPGTMPGRMRVVAGAAGVALGLLPSVIYALGWDSIEAIVRYHAEVGGSRSATYLGEYFIGGRLPLAALGIGLLGLFGALPLRRERPLLTAALIIWATALASAALSPQKIAYAQGAWLMMSAMLLGPGLRWLEARAGRYTAIGLIVGLCAVPPLAGKDGWLARGGDGIAAFRAGYASQLDLIDWLDQVAARGQVMTVAPYHPIRAAKGWSVWLSWDYAYLSRNLGAALDPHVVQRLKAGTAKVIQWDAWNQTIEEHDLMHWLVSRRYIGRDEVGPLSAELARSYRTVQWNRPLPRPYGGGRFLVHRSIQLDDRVGAVVPDPLASYVAAGG